MPQTVQVDGVGLVEFPDEFTTDQIRSSALSLMPQAVPQPPNRGVLGEVGARMGRGALQVLRGVSDYGAAAQRFYGPLAKLSPIGYGDFERSSQAIESVTPQPGVRQGFGYDVAEGLGQFAPMLLAGLGAGALAGGGAIGGAAAMGTAAGLGFGMEFSDAYDRELERQQREGLPDDPDLAFAKAMGYGAVSSLIEGKFGSGRIAKKIGEALAGDGGRMLLSRGVSPELVRRVAINAGREAGVGFGQEAAQRFAQDIIVEGRPEWEGIGYEGLVGGAVQGITGVPLGAIQARAADRNARLQAALEENKRLEQEANERRNQLIAGEMAAGREAVQRARYQEQLSQRVPEVVAEQERDVLSGPAARLAELESAAAVETFGPGFRGDIVPRIELSPDIRERLAALRKQDQEAASRAAAVQQAVAGLAALEGRPESFGPGARVVQRALPNLPPEVNERLWRLRQQEAANASAVRTSPGQLPQTGPVAQGVQTPSGNVVERQPQAEEPMVQGAQAPKPPKVRRLRSKPQPIGGETRGLQKEKGQEVLTETKATTGVQQKPAGSITPVRPETLAALGVTVGEGAPLAAWEKKSLAGLGYEPWTVDALDVGEARRIIRDKEKWKRVKPIPKQEVAEPSKQKTESLPGAAASIVDELDKLSAYGLRKKADSITLVRDKEGKVVDSYVETERIPAAVAAVEKDELTGKREEEALVELSKAIGVPGNVSAASVFARRFWENVDANATPAQKAKIADAMLRGEPTPIASDIAAKQAAGLQASVADAQNRFADFQNATPWITVGASPAIGGGQARTLRIGDATRDILGRLGAAVVEDATLDRAIAARADAAGNIELGVNAQRLGQIDPSAHNAVGTEELIHVAHFRVLHREWVEKGKPGTFAGYVEKEMGSLWRGLDQKIRDQVVAEYSGGQQVQMQDGEWGMEYMRRVIQRARYGTLTEEFVKGAKPKVESIFRRILNFLREVIVGSPYSAREFEIIAAVEAVLDGLAVNVELSPRGQAVLSGTVAGQAVKAGVSPALLVREPSEYSKIGAWKWSEAPGIIFHATSSDKPIKSGKLTRGLYGFTRPSLTFWRGADQSLSVSGKPVIYRIIAQPEELGVSPDIFVKAGTEIRVGDQSEIVNIDGEDVPIFNIYTEGTDKRSQELGESIQSGVSPAIRSVQDLQDIVTKGGSEQAPERLTARLEAERSLFDPAWIEQLDARYAQATLPKDSYTVPPTGWTLRRENMVARMLKPIVDKVHVVTGMRDPSTLPDDEQGAAYYAIANTHEWLMGRRGVVRFKLEQEKAIQEQLKELQVGADANKAMGSAKTVAANELAKGYRQYLLNVQKALPPASTLQGRISGLLSKAALAVNQDGTQKQDGWNGVFESGNVENAIQWIADQPAVIVDGTTTPEQVVDQAVAIGANGEMGIRSSVDSSNDKRDALYRGVKDDTGKYVVAPALHNIPNLPEIINLIRGLSADLKQTVKETEAFKQLLKLKPTGKNPIALRKFLSDYMRLRDEARENVEQARAFSTRFQRNENRILAFADVLGLLDGLMGTPSYFDKVVKALKATNTYEDVIHYPSGHLGDKLVHDPITNEDVRIGVGLTKENEDENIANLQRVVDNIDNYITSVGRESQMSDPLKFVSYKRASDQLKEMWIDSELAPEWNIVNPRLFGAIWPKFTPGLTKRYMAEFIGGRMGRALNTSITHLDVLLGKIYNIQQDKDIGTSAVQVALRSGMNSHEMNPDDASNNDVYQREILNWIVYEGQYASQVVHKAGDKLNSGREATPEDIAAAKKVVAYRNAIRRASEKDSIANSLHSSIAEELGVERTVDGRVAAGKTSIHRNTITEGPLETAASKRVNDSGVRDFVERFVAAGYETRLRMLDPVNEWRWFHDVIIGHLGATDPLFNRTRLDKEDGKAVWRRGSIYEDKIRKLRDKVRRGEVQLTDWESVASALGEDVDTVRKNLVSEVSGWLEKYKKQEIDTVRAAGESDAMKKIVSSLHNDGSFMHPRLKANAPPTFYKYGDSTEPDLAGYAANAANIARARVLEEMMRMTNALDLYVKSFEKGTEREKELESQRLVKAGEKRFSYAEAKRVHGQMKSLTDWFGRYAQTHAEAFDHSINQFVRATNSFYAGSLLQSPMAVLNNAIDALYSNPLLMNTYISNWRRVLLSPLYTTQQIFNVAMGRIMAATKKYPELKEWVKKNNTLLSRSLKAMIEDWESWNKLKSDLDAYGINTGLDWQNQRALRRQAWGNTFFSLDAWKRALENRDPGAVLPGLGTLESEDHKSSFILKFGRTIYNSWLPAYMMRYVPRRVDQLANVMIAMQWTKAMGKLMSKSIEISENRSVRAGQNPDPKQWHLDKNNRIQPSELDMTPAQMNILRKSLDPIGGLERVMFSYYDEWKKTRDAVGDTSAVPWMKEGEMDNWLMAVMQAGNVVREGNTIDVARAYGTPGTLFFTFLSWPANRLLNVAKSFNSMNYAKGGMPTAAALIALLITAIAAKELKRPVVEAVTGKVSSMPTLGNVANEGNPVEWARYLTSALGSMIPLIGNTVEIVTGGATGRPLFDATASIPALGLIADSVDTAKRAVQSGDQRVWLDWINRHTPLYALAINRLPGVEADLAARNAARAVRAATPADMEVRAMYGRGGGMARVTPFTRHLRSAEAAAYSGNEAALRTNIEAAKQYQMSRGQDEQSAEQAVVSYLRSRMPMSRVYGRAVSPAEYQRVTGRMSGAQRQAFEPSTKAYGLVERVTGRKLRAFREPKRKTGTRSTPRFARLPKIMTKLPSVRRMRSSSRMQGVLA